MGSAGAVRGSGRPHYNLNGSPRGCAYGSRAQEEEGDRHLKAPSVPAVAREGLRRNPVLVHKARWTALDGAVLISIALGIVLNIAAALLQRGWTTAALADTIVGGYLLALTLRPSWRPLLARLFLFGAVAGVVELATDAAGERFARSLVYPRCAPTLWASPAYMPLSWAIVLTQLGYLAWRLRGLVRLPLAMALCGLWAGANIPFYEEMAYHARWWRYAPAPGLGHTPLYVILFEALIGASLPILLRAVDRRSWRAVDRRSWRAVAFVGLVEGGWMAAAALVAWLLIGR